MNPLLKKLRRFKTLRKLKKYADSSFSSFSGPPKIAICAICRNERPYLVEWVSYYRALGVRNIHIYDNVSTDGTSELLCTLDEMGLITRKHWPRVRGVAPQRSAYADFLDGEAQHYDWVFVCDIDEFFVPTQGTMLQFIEQAKKSDPDVSAICIPWLIFGSAGEEYYDDRPVIERFTECGETPDRPVKTIFDPHRAHNMRTHFCDVLDGVYLDNTFDIAQWRTESPILFQNPEQGHGLVHHYYTKSREEWVARRAMPKADRSWTEGKEEEGEREEDDSIRQESRNMEIFDRHAYQNTVNKNALRYIERVRTQSGRINRKIGESNRRFAKYTAQIVCLTNDLLLCRMSNVQRGTQVRLVINDRIERIVPASRVLKGGSVGIALKVRWIGEPVRHFTLCPVGAGKAMTFSAADFPSNFKTLKNVLVHMPQAEALIMHYFLNVLSIDGHTDRLVNLDYPAFSKFPEYGGLIRSVIRWDEDTDFLEAELSDLEEIYGKSMMDRIAAVREALIR